MNRNIKKAIKMLAEEYRKAMAQVSVRKPMAYALYQVWRYFDQHEKSRMTDEDEPCYIVFDSKTESEE